MSKISFLALGGLDEADNPCYALTIDNDIYLLNAGISIPHANSLGIKKIVPDFKWIIENKQNIKGLFIGSAFYSHFGALEFLIRYLPNLAIYTNETSGFIINNYFNLWQKQHNATEKTFKPNINIMGFLKPVKIGNCLVTSFRVTNDLPYSNGFVFNTRETSVVFMDEFIVNSSKSNLYDSNYFKLPEITKNREVILITGTGQISKNKGFTAPNHRITRYYNDLISDLPNRIFIAFYESSIFKMLSLIAVAANNNRPVIIYGGLFNPLLRNLIAKKHLLIKNLRLLDPSQMNKVNDAIIIISSPLDQLCTRLEKIVAGDDALITFNENDTFIYSENTVNGFERAEATLIDHLHKTDISNIIKLPREILPLRASLEDHKLIVNILKPKYVIPVSGLYIDLNKYRADVSTSFVSYNNVIVLDNGEEIAFENNELSNKKKIHKFKPQTISSQGTIDSVDSSLREREDMKEEGALVLALRINKANRSIIEYYFEEIGIANLQESYRKQAAQNTQNKIIELLKEYLKNNSEAKNLDEKAIKNYLRKVVEKQYSKNFNKRPLLIPSIILK